jgi:hypothetical protein
MHLSATDPFLNLSLQRAAEFSGASRTIPLPEPAFITNPYSSQRNRLAAAKDL